MALYAAVLFAMCWHAFGETRKPLHGRRQSSAPRGSTRAVFASRSVPRLGLGGGDHLRRALLLPAAVADGLHRLPGLVARVYGWIPAGGSLVYIFSTTMCRTLLRRYGPVRTVRLGASLSLTGPVIQALGCLLLPLSAVPLLVGHAVYCLGHGIHQPCGQAGAVGDLPHLAGRAVSWSGFGMMMVAFCVGQVAARSSTPLLQRRLADGRADAAGRLRADGHRVLLAAALQHLQHRNHRNHRNNR
jgi:DHA1 family bicyclomycin/chloramphenicol resistance-like MFS transporter